MRNKAFLLSCIIGGISWIAVSTFLILLNNPDVFCMLIGLQTAVGISLSVYSLTAGRRTKINTTYYLFFLFYFIFVMFSLPSITSGRVVLTALTLILSFVIFPKRIYRLEGKMLLIMASIFVFVFVVISINAIFVYLKETKLKKRLTGRFDEATTEASEQKGMTKNVLVFASTLGSFIERAGIPIFPNMAEGVRINLGTLGEPYSNIKPFTFIGMQFMAAAAAVLFAMLVFSIQNIIGLLIFAVGGFFLPLLWVKEQVKKKHKAIFKQLPYVLDLLTLMVEAGLDFGAALNKVLESEKGALVDEFNTAQQEIKLGKAREAALLSMADRVNYLSLTTVINALTLAFKTGGSIAPTLRILSEQFRIERSQLAEKMAGQAPLKMMGPLILLIFPTIFIILFGPIILSFIGGRYW